MPACSEGKERFVCYLGGKVSGCDGFQSFLLNPCFKYL